MILHLIPVHAVLCLSLLLSVPVYAQTVPLPDFQKHSEAQETKNSEKKHVPQTLDDLYKRLSQAKDAEEAAGISRLIDRRQSKSGSPTVDLLMKRAQKAQNTGNPALAVELSDRALVLEPTWAPGWTERASFFILLNDPIAALDDLKKAVSLEPRLFHAWARIGTIFFESEENKAALAAFRKAIEIYPFFPEVLPFVQQLTRKLEGYKI